MAPLLKQRSAVYGIGAIACVVLLVAGIQLGRPVYWRFKAEYLKPFNAGGATSIGEKTVSKSAAAAPKKQSSATEATPAATIKPAEQIEKIPADPRAVLSRERVQKQAQNGYLMVTWANHHYLDFALSWVKHVKDCGVTGFMVGAMDEQILDALLEKDIPTFSMSAGLTTGDFGWGSKSFAKMGRQKIRLIAMFLKLGVQVIIADVDTAWMRNPIPFFERFREADILSSSDHVRPTVHGESLEIWPMAASAANIGIMLFREKSLAFVEEWIAVIEADDKIWDQNAFNDLFRRGAEVHPDNKEHYFMADNGKLKMGILPVALFASGHTYFVQRQAERQNMVPYAVHATFQYSGTPGKKHRFREALMWDDPPSYFDHPTGFITFDNEIPPAILNNSGPLTGGFDIANTVGHFELMKLQLVRMRNGLAIATVLGRAIIVPELWCGLDRYWAPHTGRLPGADYPLPYKCPLDHLFDLEMGWSTPHPEVEFGPDIPYKEHSFLVNPRLPAAVNNSRLVIEMCDPEGNPGCERDVASSPPAVKDGRLLLPIGLDSGQLEHALAEAKSYKILEFTSMDGAFKGFENKEAQRKFDNRMKIYGSLWCCVDAHPGHVHYDLLWDKPHTDRFGRQWTTWNITTGP